MEQDQPTALPTAQDAPARNGGPDLDKHQSEQYAPPVPASTSDQAVAHDEQTLLVRPSHAAALAQPIPPSQRDQPGLAQAGPGPLTLASPSDQPDPALLAPASPNDVADLDQLDPGQPVQPSPASNPEPHHAHQFPRVIAMDGPAGAGKSTIGRLLAERLGYLFFDTGVMYRAVTAAALEDGIALDDEPALSKLASELPLAIRQPNEAEAHDHRAYTVIMRERDVTHALRRAEVDSNVSQVSAHRGVREALVTQQRRVAETVGQPGGPNGIVMAGRDIGTVVLTNADLKFYLDASAEERARRRNAELVARGVQQDFATTLADIERRDHIDSTRAISPLVKADDAIAIVTDGEEIYQTMTRVMQAITASHI